LVSGNLQGIVEGYDHAETGLDLIDIIHKGAIATYPLILLSIISVTVILERLWSLKNIGSITCASRNPSSTPSERTTRFGDCHLQAEFQIRR
jgi:hypothetical protein